jgi:hypothetical protein
MMDTMHDVMPKMMANCLAEMNDQEKESMLKFCHEMLKYMEKKVKK